MSARVALVTGVWLAAVALRSGPVQTPPTDGMTSTTAGVYTPAQAEAGQQIFEATCIGGCHNMADHRGPAFKLRWEGHLTWELYSTIFEKMPKDDAGSLSEADAIDLVAYLLKLNGLPPGKDALPTDEAALRKIKIALPAGGDARPARSGTGK